MPIQSIDPATGQVIEEIDELSDAEIDERISRAARAYGVYRRTTIELRARMLSRVADLLEAEAPLLAGGITLEMGKPLASAIDEVKKSARACRYYAEHGAAHLADVEIRTEGMRSFVRFLPLGVVLAIMPWNFPFWQTFRCASAALMAGNVVLFKPASSTPRCALVIEKLLARAGYSEGIFQTLLVSADRVRRVIDDPRVAAVSLTGSTEAGRSVGARAAQRLKKTVLELGGSDPFIVMPSANLEDAARVGVRARTVNAGQACNAAKRFIIHREVYPRFEELFVRGMQELRVGDPLDPETDVGPLATREAIERVERQVRESVEAGARVKLGGDRLPRKGFFYAPTVLVDVPKGSPAYDDEIFGPVASLFSVSDVDEAIDLANATRYGLASSVWTTDRNERARFIDEIEAGMTFFGAMVSSDPRLPFGGVKDSGYGRELSREGLREFVNVKTIRL
ncbi:MAG: NAD-dependent succinate-semialdehyde dehydrogenase [Labilithrix sp.]|nr:NAD-dependent succinate-semialdehyde dehydrogenase [Labilithrix sp.]